MAEWENLEVWDTVWPSWWSWILSLWCSTVSSIFKQPTILLPNGKLLLVERLERIPFAPSTTFLVVCTLFCWDCLDLHESLSVSNESMVHFWSVEYSEILLMLIFDVGPNVAYNGLILLVLRISSMVPKSWIPSDRRYWFAFILVSFLMLCDQFRRLSLFFRYLSWCLYSFLSCLIRILPFLKEFPLCLEYGALHYFGFVLYYECSCGKPRRKKSGRHGFEGQYGVEQLYGLVWEKLQRIESASDCSGDSRYLGTRANRISAGLDAVRVLIDIDPNRAKEQVKSVSEVVREGSRCRALSIASVQVPFEDESQRCFGKDDPRVPNTFQLAGWFTLWMGRCRYGRHWLKIRSFVRSKSLWPMRFPTVMPVDEPSFFGWRRLPDRVAGPWVGFETLTYG